MTCPMLLLKKIKLPFKKFFIGSKKMQIFDHANKNSALIFFTTGLISQSGKDFINPDQCYEVGKVIQSSRDGCSFTDKFDLKAKVKNLSYLRKSVRINNEAVILDSLTLFHRLILVAERESIIN